MNTEATQTFCPVPNRTHKNTLKKSSAIMVDGKLYGPTNHQISVWEYEGGGYMDPSEDPLAHRKSFLKKTFNYFQKNLLSLF